MKTSALVLVAAAVSFGSSAVAEPKPAAGAQVVLGHVVEAVGASYDDALTVETIMTRTTDGKQQTASRRRTVRRTFDVLARSAEAISKAKLSYAEYTPPQGSGAAVVGPTYVLELADGAVHFTRADGAAVTAGELALLKDDNKRFGKPDEFAQALAGIPFVMGTRTVIPPDSLKSWDEFPQPVDVAFTLDKTDGAQATFAIEIHSQDKATGQSMSLNGTAVVEIKTGRVMTSTSAGTFSAPGGISGTATQKQVSTYRAAVIHGTR